MNYNGVVNEYLPYLITLLKAIGIFLVGLGLSTVGKTLVSKGLSKIHILERETEFIQSFSKLVYYFILLITIVAVLEILGLKYITQPFIDLLNEVLVYIPNIIGAGLILFLGILLAKISKEFIKSLLITFKVEEFAKQYKIENLSGAVANFVYLIIILFVIMASLNALGITVISEPATQMIASILLTIPKVIAGLIIFGVIFFLGKLVAEIISKIVDDINIDEVANYLGISSEKLKFDKLVKYLILTFATLIGLSQAFSYVEATALSLLTQQLLEIIFKVLVASAIVFVAMFIGKQIEDKLENKNFGKGIKYLLILMSVFLALPFIGISPEIIEIFVFTITLGLGIAFALAFGLGGKDIAREILKDIFLKNKNSSKE